jgi:hypothetical protein
VGCILAVNPCTYSQVANQVTESLELWAGFWRSSGRDQNSGTRLDRSAILGSVISGGAPLPASIEYQKLVTSIEEDAAYGDPTRAESLKQSVHMAGR